MLIFSPEWTKSKKEQNKKKSYSLDQVFRCSFLKGFSGNIFLAHNKCFFYLSRSLPIFSPEWTKSKKEQNKRKSYFLDQVFRYSFLKGFSGNIILTHNKCFFYLRRSLPIWKQQRKVTSSERSFAEISVRRKAVPYYPFFFKKIYKGVQFHKFCRHRACNVTKNWLKKMVRTLVTFSRFSIINI